MKSWIKLWQIFSKKRKLQFCALLFLMVFTSFLEMLSIGSVLPLLGVLTMPDQFLSSSVVLELRAFFNIGNEYILFLITALFCLFSLAAGITRVVLVWATTKFSFNAGADFGLDIYVRTLYQPYSVHISRNSSEVINGITFLSNSIIYNNVIPLLNLVSSTIIFFAITLVLFYLNPIIALLSFSFFGTIYFFIVSSTRKKLLANGTIISVNSTKSIQNLQEGLGSIRDVLLDGTQKIYVDEYRKCVRALRLAQSNNLFIAQSPRFIIESMGMVFIATLAYILTKDTDKVIYVVPMLGVLAIGAQRMLPLLQQIYAGISEVNGSRAALQKALELLNQPIPKRIFVGKPGDLKFASQIKLVNLGYSYGPEGREIFSDVNLSICKGDRVGIVGKTGAGKSTFVDVLIGLLKPTSGWIEVDGLRLDDENIEGWQKLLAHVPQSIYLTDASILENIAIGTQRSQIDHNLIHNAASRAHLNELIDRLQDKYETTVGERGIQLSGGQRQRIGIARALYKNAEILIFDEATSALDSETEEMVINQIEAMDKAVTTIAIAHRLSTLKKCNKIIEICSGEVKIYSNKEFFERSL